MRENPPCSKLSRTLPVPQFQNLNAIILLLSHCCFQQWFPVFYFFCFPESGDQYDDGHANTNHPDIAESFHVCNALAFEQKAKQHSTHIPSCAHNTTHQPYIFRVDERS